MPIPLITGKVIRIMRRLVRDVGKERLAVASIRLYIADHLVGIGPGRVIVVRQAFKVTPVFGENEAWRISAYVHHAPVISSAVQQAEITFEATRRGDLVRIFTQVPFAGHVRVISGLFEQLR